MGGRPHRARAARPPAAAAARSAPHAGAAGAGGGLRRLQLPARLLGGRRRHRLGLGGGLPGGGQGASSAPRHQRAGRPGRGRRGAPDRHAGGSLLVAARRLAPRRRGAGEAPGDPGRRLHRLAAGRPRAVRSGGTATRADSGLRRDGLVESGLRAARGDGRERRAHRRGTGRLGDPGRRTVLHQPGTDGGDRRRRRGSLRGGRAAALRRGAGLHSGPPVDQDPATRRRWRR